MADEFERRVAKRWTVAGDPSGWADVELGVDGKQIRGRALVLNRDAFVRVLLPDCDLEIQTSQRRLARLPQFQRMTAAELGPLLDDWRRRRAA